MQERTSELKKRLNSVGEEISEVDRGEKKVSEEIIQVEKTADLLESQSSDSWEASGEDDLSGEALEDLKKAAEDLETVSRELESIGEELGEDISGEESLLESLRDVFEGVKSGDRTVSGQGAEEFAEVLNETASEVMETEEEVEEVMKEAEKAEEEGRRLLQIIENSGMDEGKLESLNTSIRNSVKRCERAHRNFQNFREELGEEVEDSSRRGFMKAAGTASAGAIMGFSGCAGLDDQLEKAKEISQAAGRENPLGTQTPVVSVEEGANLVEGFQAILEKALRFWERHDERYLGYSVDFSRNDSASSPDISIYVRQRIERCEDMTGAGLVGCYDPDGGSAKIKIESGYERVRIEETLKHELGHALGLRHGDAPQGIMSRNRSRRQENTEEKARIAKLFNRGMKLHNQGIDRYRKGIELYRNEHWRESQNQFEKSRKKFKKSVNRLEQAAGLCREIGESDAEKVIARGETNARLMAEATGYLVESIEAGFNGNRDKRELLFGKYQESFREAREVNAPSEEELRRTLEL